MSKTTLNSLSKLQYISEVLTPNLNDMRKFDDSLPLQLLKTRDGLMQYFRPLLTRHQYTDQQWRIMRALYEFKELEPSQLAERCNILAPSLTGMLNRLEQSGLIYKRKQMEDKRRFVVGMTATARDKFDELSVEVEACYEQMCQDIGKDLVNELSQVLRQVEQRLEQNKLG